MHSPTLTLCVLRPLSTYPRPLQQQRNTLQVLGYTPNIAWLSLYPCKRMNNLRWQPAATTGTLPVCNHSSALPWSRVRRDSKPLISVQKIKQTSKRTASCALNQSFQKAYLPSTVGSFSHGHAQTPKEAQCISTRRPPLTQPSNRQLPFAPLPSRSV